MINFVGRSSAVLFLTLSLGTVRAADSPTPKGYIAGRATTPIIIDGKLDDAAWKDAPWTEDFVDIQGDLKPKPRFRTRAKMAWDDTYFYIAAELSEPHVWGTLTNHDSVIFHDNDFEVFIDPDGDNHEYYELEINALNTEWDLLLEKPYRDGGPAVDSWEVPGLRTATHVNGRINDPTGEDQSWTVEFAIPWKSLEPRAHRPSPPLPGDQWRINFSRVEWEVTHDAKGYKKVPNKPEDNWVWSPQGVIDMHRPSRWSFVQFSTESPGKGSFHLDPAWPVREQLMSIYEAQRTFHQKNKNWAIKVDQLGLAAEPAIPGAKAPVFRATSTGYEVDIAYKAGPNQPEKIYSIHQDSRLISKP